VGRSVDRTVLLDLDLAAAEVERRWFVWTAAGIRVHPITSAASETERPPPLVARPGTSTWSLAWRASRPNAQADVVLHADGWVETAVRRPDAAATVHATAQVDSVEAFGLLLERVVELITWSGPGPGQRHPAPARPVGPQRAPHWVLGFDGLPMPDET
jgi:hypothetical protein